MKASNEKYNVIDTTALASKLTLSENESTILETENNYRDKLDKKYQDLANAVTSQVIFAQQLFFSEEYEIALYLVNQVNKFKENADVLALKGSIYLGLGDRERFKTLWKQALELDRNTPLPPSPYIIQQLQVEGLLNDKLERDF